VREREIENEKNA
jgi:hypothetical protein